MSAQVFRSGPTFFRAPADQSGSGANQGRTSGRFVPPHGAPQAPTGPGTTRSPFGAPDVDASAFWAANADSDDRYEDSKVPSTTPFQIVGKTLRKSFSYLFDTHARYFTIALLLFLGAVGALLVLGWARGFPITWAETWSVIVLGYGAVGFLLFFMVSLVILHWLTVWLAQTLMLDPHAVPRPKKPLGERLFFIITFFASVWTGYTSYYGFQIVFFSPDEGIRYWLVPILAGLIACGFVFTFWTTLFERMEMANVWQKLVLLLVIAPIGTTIIFGMSTATGVLGIGGDAAITYHMRQNVDAMRQTLTDIRQERDMEYDRLIPIMRQTALRFARLADEEEQRGSLTSAAGSGAVSNYLRDLSNHANSIAEMIETRRRDESIEILELNDQMRRLREAFGSRGRQFRAQFETLIRDMNALQGEIGKVVGSSPVDIVRFQIATMREIQPLTASSVNHSFADSQRTVVANLQIEKNNTLTEIDRTLRELQDRSRVEPPTFEVMHDLEAILVYWRQIWLSWAISIATDMGPFLWILVAAVMPVGNYLHSQRKEEVWVETNYPSTDA